MYDFFAATGARNSPMFLNFRPFRLDLSPVLETDEAIARMSADIKAKRAAQEEAIRSLPIPELKGLSPDLVYPYEAAMGARSTMLSRLNSGLNPFWVAKNDPDFVRAQQDYTRITSPAIQARLTEEQDDAKYMEERIKAAQEEGMGGAHVYDSDGMLVGDPNYPQRALTIGGWDKNRKETWNTWEGGYPKARESVVPSSKAFEEMMSKTFQNAGFSAMESNVGGEANMRAWMGAREAANDPMGKVFAEVVLNSGNKSNAANLASAMRSAMDKLSPQHRAYIQEMYMQTPEFQEQYYKELKDKPKDGKFTVSGQLDPAKVYNATFGSPDFNSPFGKDSVPFAHKFLQEKVATMLVNENKVSASLLKAGGVDGNGGSGGSEMSNKDVQLFQLARAGVPRDQTGAPTGRAVDLPVAIGARVSGKPVTIMAQSKGYIVPFSSEAVDVVRESNGITPQTIEAGAIPLTKVFTSAQVYTLNGAKIPEEALKNATLASDLPNDLFFTPKYWGAEELTDQSNLRQGYEKYGIPFGPRMDGKEFIEGPPVALGDGSSEYRPMMKVKIKIPGDYIQDYAPKGAVEGVNRSRTFTTYGVHGFTQVPSSSTQVGVEYSDKATDVSRNFVEKVPVNHAVFQNSEEVKTDWNWGDNETTIEVLVDVDRGFEFLRDARVMNKAYMLEEYGRSVMQDQAAQAGQSGAPLNSQSYQQVISPYIQAPAQ